MDVTIRTAKRIIKTMMKINKPVVVLGSPGIGKTEGCFKQNAKELGMSFLCFDAPGLHPTDVRGALGIDGDRSFYTKSPLLPDVKLHGEKGVLLIDEITSAVPAVQVSLHALFHPEERRLGSDRLPDGWIPMATGNYASDGAGALTILTALSDRLEVLNVAENYEEWKEDYAFPVGLHFLVMGFINQFPQHFNTFKKRAKGNNGKGFASPRAWKDVSDVLYVMLDNALRADLQAAVAGYIGDGVAVELMAFVDTYEKMPDIDDILIRNRNIHPKDRSVLFGVCSALAAKLAAYKGEIPKSVLAERVVNYAMSIPDREFGILLVNDAFKASKEHIVASQAFKKFVKGNKDFIVPGGN